MALGSGIFEILNVNRALGVFLGIGGVLIFDLLSGAGGPRITKGRRLIVKRVITDD